MRLALSIQCARSRSLPGDPDHGMYVAWAELGGIDVTGPLAYAADRETAEHQARLELAQRARRRIESPRLSRG